jgi:hypothetical protein
MSSAIFLNSSWMRVSSAAGGGGGSADHESPADGDALWDGDAVPGRLGVVGAGEGGIEGGLGGVGAGDVGQLGVRRDGELGGHGRAI